MTVVDGAGGHWAGDRRQPTPHAEGRRVRYPSVPTGAGLPLVACWARRGPLTPPRYARHPVHVLPVGAAHASPGRAERRGDRRAMTPHPVDTPHPASLALGAPSPAPRGRGGRGVRGDPARASPGRAGMCGYVAQFPGSGGPGGSGTPDPGGSRTRDPYRWWRWSSRWRWAIDREPLAPDHTV